MRFDGGIILIDKPAGLTSHDIVAFIKKKFAFGKVGHAGTLDPMATGLLIIMAEKFTKKFVHFANYDKEYEGRLSLGSSTDTGDREGKIIRKADWKFCAVNTENIKDVFMSFLGEIRQIPPMYSAKKVKGRKLYELARKGLTVRRPPSTVSIREIKILNIALPQVTFYVRCSKGTYIRQLAHDIGEKIGCGAHLVSLRRTGIGPFNLREATPPHSVTHENILQPE